MIRVPRCSKLEIGLRSTRWMREIGCGPLPARSSILTDRGVDSHRSAARQSAAHRARGGRPAGLPRGLEHTLQVIVGSSAVAPLRLYTLSSFSVAPYGQRKYAGVNCGVNCGGVM